MSNESDRKEACFMRKGAPADRANAEYVADINKYRHSSVSPCRKEHALKLLKQFARKDFSVFWNESVCEYFPAIAEGTMKLAEKVHTHNDAIKYAKSLIIKLNPKDLSRSFLYGVSHHAPEYRTALACYYFVKNLPEHDFEKRFIGVNATGDVYSDNTCEVCNYNSQLSNEPKMQFWHINVSMYHFYVQALVPFCFNLNTAIIYLEEYLKLPEPSLSKDDLDFFEQIIALIEVLPDNTPPSTLRNELKQSHLLKMTIAQIDAFIDMLGYLNILHTNDSFGVTRGHTKEQDMLEPLSDRSYFAHPVNRWTRKCGIDYNMINQLFGDLY